jgi:hypothetical protein
MTNVLSFNIIIYFSILLYYFIIIFYYYIILLYNLILLFISHSYTERGGSRTSTLLEDNVVTHRNTSDLIQN